MDCWTNEILPHHRRYAAWQERLVTGHTPARTKRPGPIDGAFPVSTKLSQVGPCRVLIVDAPAHWMELQPREGAGVDKYFLLCLLSPARISSPSDAVDLDAGSLTLIDPGCGQTLESRGRVNYASISIPRRTLDTHVSPRRWPGDLVPLSAQDALGGLVSGYARSLLPGAPGFALHQAAPVVDILCRLLALQIDQATRHTMGARAAVRAARMNRVKRMIIQRLAVPDLSPTMIAQFLGMTPRNLHLLFRHEYETFSQFVMTSRLEACRTALLDPSQASRSITEIAFGCGFANLTTFYRSFRTLFAMTPLEMRASSNASHFQIIPPRIVLQSHRE